MAGEPLRDPDALLMPLVHLYRGEVARSDTWRARLDNTTNWALTSTAAVVSFGLGSANASHAVILFGIFLVVNFLFIEVRRYRVWDVYLRRVRILETRMYAPLLREEPIDTRQLRELASMLEAPRVVLSFPVALAQRVRRAYGPILVVLTAAWIVKLLVRGYEIQQPASRIVDRMHIGFVPGWFVLVVVAMTLLTLAAVTVWSLLHTPPPTEMAAARPRRRPLRAAFEHGMRPRVARPQPAQ